MVNVVDVLERVTRTVWRFHFRIPPAVFWLALLGGTVSAFFVATEALIWPLALAALGAQGILRWRHHRRSPVLLLVPLIETYGDEGRARRVQDQILNSLRQALTPAEMELVHAIPVVVGPNDTALAHTFLKRFGALYVLYGRTEDRPDGGWSVLAGIVREAPSNVVHLDWHTRDRTAAENNWGALREVLTPARAVEDVEHPLAFTSELEALVRGLAGQVAAVLHDDERAERLLAEAIAASGDSPAHPIDELRWRLAELLRRTGRRDEALALLRRRAAENTPSPELLRQLARQLGPQPGEFGAGEEPDESDRAEAVAMLRRAADYRADPRRPMTLYNLMARLPHEGQEAEDIVVELMSTSAFYRGAWYVRRHRGAIHWYRGLAIERSGNMGAAREEFAAAGRWYSAALRARPHLRLLFPVNGVRKLWMWFPRSPVLHANARDAHHRAGHRFRAVYHAWMTNRARVRRLKRGFRRAKRGEWTRAYAHFDFATMGESDFLEATAATYRVIALKQMHKDAAAEYEWAETRDRIPTARLVMADAMSRAGDFPAGLPGDEPADVDRVRRELVEQGHLADE